MSPDVVAELARYAELTDLYHQQETLVAADDLDLAACRRQQAAVVALVAELRPATAFTDRPPEELDALAEAAGAASAARERVAQALDHGQARRRTGAGTQTRDATALRHYAGTQAAIPRFYDAQG